MVYNTRSKKDTNLSTNCLSSNSRDVSTSPSVKAIVASIELETYSLRKTTKPPARVGSSRLTARASFARRLLEASKQPPVLLGKISSITTRITQTKGPSSKIEASKKREREELLSSGLSPPSKQLNNTSSPAKATESSKDHSKTADMSPTEQGQDSLPMLRPPHDKLPNVDRARWALPFDLT